MRILLDSVSMMSCRTSSRHYYLFPAPTFTGKPSLWTICRAVRCYSWIDYRILIRPTVAFCTSDEKECQSRQRLLVWTCHFFLRARQIKLSVKCCPQQ